MPARAVKDETIFKELATSKRTRVRNQSHSAKQQ
jgi:hypothetical protein